MIWGKRAICSVTMLICMVSGVYSAMLYNMSNDPLERQLGLLRSQYGADIDIVYLSETDECVDEQNPQKCVMRTYADTAHLIVVLNTKQRMLVSYFNGDDRLQFFSKQRTQAFEQAARDALTRDDYRGGLRDYLNEVTTQLIAECARLQVDRCSIDAIDTATVQRDNATKAANRRLQRGLVWSLLLAIIVFVVGIWLLRWVHRRRIIARYTRDLATMEETLRFLLMQVQADKELYEDSKVGLLDKLQRYQARLEDMRTSSYTSMYTRMQAGERAALLDDLMGLATEYKTLRDHKATEREVFAKLETLRQIDL